MIRTTRECDVASTCIHTRSEFLGHAIVKNDDEFMSVTVVATKVAAHIQFNTPEQHLYIRWKRCDILLFIFFFIFCSNAGWKSGVELVLRLKEGNVDC